MARKQINPEAEQLRMEHARSHVLIREMTDKLKETCDLVDHQAVQIENLTARLRAIALIAAFRS